MKTVTVFAPPQEVYKSLCLTFSKSKKQSIVQSITKMWPGINIAQTFKQKHEGADISTGQLTWPSATSEYILIWDEWGSEGEDQTHLCGFQIETGLGILFLLVAFLGSKQAIWLHKKCTGKEQHLFHCHFSWQKESLAKPHLGNKAEILEAVSLKPQTRFTTRYSL